MLQELNELIYLISCFPGWLNMVKPFHIQCSTIWNLIPLLGIQSFVFFLELEREQLLFCFRCVLHVALNP